jgi:hypothetical protein
MLSMFENLKKKINDKPFEGIRICEICGEHITSSEAEYCGAGIYIHNDPEKCVP